MLRIITNKKYNKMQEELKNKSNEINKLEMKNDCLLNYIKMIGIPPYMIGINALYSHNGKYVYSPTKEDCELMQSEFDPKKNPIHNIIFKMLKDLKEKEE